MPISDYMRKLREKIGHQLVEIPSVAILAFDDQQRVALVYHSEVDVWTIPGGAIEPLEVPADAATREMWEETGLDVDLLRVIGVYGGPEFTTSYKNGDRVSFAMIVFEAKVLGGDLRPDGEETLDVRWFARSELERLPVQPWVPQVLANAFADRERVHFEASRWRP